MTKVVLAQFTAVAIEGRALLMDGPPGCGKTSLALALIDRGATLIGDDGIRLDSDSAHLVATPPPATAGKIEIRNVGIIELPPTSAPVALILQVTPDAPRYVERAPPRMLHGHNIPALPFALAGICDAVRAEHALTLHGLCGSAETR